MPLKYVVLLFLVFAVYGCKPNNNTAAKVQQQKATITKADSLKAIFDSFAKMPPEKVVVKPQRSQYVHQSDTAKINGRRYVLGVYKDTSTCYFFVLKQGPYQFDTIMVDNSYGTNHSDLFFKDQNNDDLLDIVWTKRWQDHAYLFNPHIENFIEAGEFHDIDTLKEDGKPVLFKNKYPLLYLINEEKDMGWMMEKHSELFVITSTYKKISFATLDNMASLDDENIDRCHSNKSVLVHCYVPPYFANGNNIWNQGNSADTIFIKSAAFNQSFILNYWLQHYNSLLKYGTAFKVRRDQSLVYYKW